MLIIKDVDHQNYCIIMGYNWHAFRCWILLFG